MLIENQEAEKEKLLAKHRAELDEKETQIFDARQAAQEAERTLRSAEGNYSKMKRSLELTGANVKDMQAQQK